MSDTWNTTVYGVLVDEGKLFLEVEGEYGLPSVEFGARALWLNNYAPLQLSLSKVFNCNINILRRIHIKEDLDKQTATVAFALEVADTSAPKGNWIDHETLTSINPSNFKQTDIIQKVISEMDNDLSPNGRPAWAQTGWYEETSTWITSTLKNLGYSVKEIQLVKTWNISCVLKVITNKDDVYFKANYDFPLFSDEAALYTLLNKDFPENIPEILATNEHGDFLLKGYTFALKTIPYENQHKLLQQSFKFHQAYLGKKDAVLGIGCADRSLGLFPEQLATALKADYIQKRLTQEEVDYLEANFSLIEDVIKELNDGPIPHTLIHGDLHLGNVAFDGDTIIFLDWTDASYSHPFFDAIHDIYFWDDRALADKLRDEYLALWLKYLDDVTFEELLRLWNLATPLYVLQRVVTDYSFVENMEASSQYEFIDGCLMFLRFGIKSLKEL